MNPTPAPKVSLIGIAWPIFVEQTLRILIGVVDLAVAQGERAAGRQQGGRSVVGVRPGGLGEVGGVLQVAACRERLRQSDGRNCKGLGDRSLGRSTRHDERPDGARGAGALVSLYFE